MKTLHVYDTGIQGMKQYECRGHSINMKEDEKMKNRRRTSRARRIIGDILLILTGGNADESGRTEADVMRGILAERGVPEDRMILEDQAKTTKENFSNIAGIISAEEPVVMISSNYHMDRAVRTASENGFPHVMRLPAPSGLMGFGANMLSEVVLDLNDLTK